MSFIYLFEIFGLTRPGIEAETSQTRNLCSSTKLPRWFIIFKTNNNVICLSIKSSIIDIHLQDNKEQVWCHTLPSSGHFSSWISSSFYSSSFSSQFRLSVFPLMATCIQSLERVFPALTRQMPTRVAQHTPSMCRLMRELSLWISFRGR